VQKLMSWFGVAILGAFLAGCGGGGGSDSGGTAVAAGQDEGQLVVALTDAQGDFVSYSVDVTSVVLERADGTRVEALPLRTRVDFADLTDVTELLTIATVPEGRYRSITLGLDFTDADVIVQDDAGALHDALLLDESGNPAGQMDVRLTLADADAVVIRAGIPAAVSLDFDLEASNSIDFGVAPPTVTIQPFLLATPELEPGRSHRVRGLLESVHEADSSVALTVRPFHRRSGTFGEFTFLTDSDTLYEIDGLGYAGSDGLAALSDLDPGTPVVAAGTVQDGGFLAGTVLAGTSVWWTAHDVARGAVIARSGEALTLSGVTVEYEDGVVVRRGELTVTLGPDTVVTALGLPNESLDGDSISVGQRIVAFGKSTDDASFDATAGRVRMQISELTAEVVATGDLTVDLYRLNGRRPQVYDFAGTGIDPANDADPAHYRLDTATLPLSLVQVGDLVRVRGHVNRFGAAPADFLALSLVDVALDARGAVLGAGWPEPDAGAITQIGAGRVDLDLTDARAALAVRGVPLERVNPIEGIALTAPADSRGVYAVRALGEIHLYRSFDDLTAELQRQLDAGRLLRWIGATGRYNATAGALVSRRSSFDFVESGI
jgi:hypothetical protein